MGPVFSAPTGLKSSVPPPCGQVPTRTLVCAPRVRSGTDPHDFNPVDAKNDACDPRAVRYRPARSFPTHTLLFTLGSVPPGPWASLGRQGVDRYHMVPDRPGTVTRHFPHHGVKVVCDPPVWSVFALGSVSRGPWVTLGRQGVVRYPQGPVMFPLPRGEPSTCSVGTTSCMQDGETL